MEDEFQEIAIQGACAEAAALLANRLGQDVGITILIDTTEGKGGIYLHGHSDPQDMMGKLLEHVQAIFQAHGLNFQTMNIGRPGSG